MRAVRGERRLRNRRTDLRSRRIHLPPRLHQQRRLLDRSALLRHHDVVVRGVPVQRPVRGDGYADLRSRRPLRPLRG